MSECRGVRVRPQLLQSAENPGPDYDREPTFSSMARDMDVMVPMRDGVKICVDVYRPEAPGKFPALLAFAIYNKDFQGPDMAAALPPQPAWSPLWTGPMEAGDTKFFVSRGYVHVIGSPRGVGKSEGGGSREWDCYDLIEWIAAQTWCDGNVGMVGISGFGAEQLAVAKKQPPHLKAIFPFDSRGAYGELGGFRDEYPGGVIHLFRYLVGHFSAMHQHKGPPGALPPERETMWREAMNNPDYKMYPHVYNLIAQKGQHMPPYYNVLVDPFDSEAAVQKSEAEFAAHQSADLYGLRLVRLHLQDPSQRLPALVQQYQGAEEAVAGRAGASGAAVSHVPRRSAALARSLAQGHRHRHHGRAAGAVLGDGRQ